jgi:hypothetical protein
MAPVMSKTAAPVSVWEAIAVMAQADAMATAPVVSEAAVPVSVWEATAVMAQADAMATAPVVSEAAAPVSAWEATAKPRKVFLTLFHCSQRSRVFYAASLFDSRQVFTSLETHAADHVRKFRG